MSSVNHFYNKLAEEIKQLGGMHNAHLHLDRAGTIADKYLPENNILDTSYVSLHAKHAMINQLHAGPAYDQSDLSARINQALDIMVSCNTKQADSLVDVTADRVGLSALETMTAIKNSRAKEIELNIGAYSPLGFSDADPARWEIFKEGAQQADFIAALPEADDRVDYPDHIGFEEHCQRTLSLAQDLGCMLHVHTDQRNDERERGTERLIEVAKAVGLNKKNEEPWLWVVHMISPSTYDEARFDRLVDDMLSLNIGLICCPSAAIGMRQFRPLATPTYNSIPRVLEMLKAGVPVRLASDNIADICSPTTTANLIDEVFVLSAAIRFYHIGILASLACGKKLNEQQQKLISDHLEQNELEISKALNTY
jgi:cytosine/adenosine deaminase-related metal-dependent hydrolase